MREASGLPRSPLCPSRSILALALSLLRAWGCPAPQTAVPLSPRRRRRRRPVLAPGFAPAARFPPPLHLGQRTQAPADPCTAPGTASCSRSPPAVLFFPDCHPPALYSLSSLSRRTPLWCGPETLLPFSSALGSVVVICDCPLTRGTQTPWTGLSRRKRSWPAVQEAEEALGSWTQWLPGCRARALGPGRLPPLRLPASLDSTRARLPRTRPLPDHPTSSPCTATATP